MGSFHVDADGRITRWRYSYDLKSVTDQLRPPGSTFPYSQRSTLVGPPRCDITDKQGDKPAHIDALASRSLTNPTSSARGTILEWIKAGFEVPPGIVSFESSSYITGQTFAVDGGPNLGGTR